MSSQVPGDTDDLRDRSLGELLKQLSEQTTRLVHQELEIVWATSWTWVLVRPERKTRAPCAASSLATALPTSPPAPKMTAVLSSRRRALFVGVIDGMIAPFLRS
jgi:hypothetical protein